MRICSRKEGTGIPVRLPFRTCWIISVLTDKPTDFFLFFPEAAKRGIDDKTEAAPRIIKVDSVLYECVGAGGGVPEIIPIVTVVTLLTALATAIFKPAPPSIIPLPNRINAAVF